MSFAKMLKIGIEYEEKVLNTLKKKYPLAVRIEGQFLDYDIWIPEISKSVEVKYDKRSETTGNIIITDSNIQTSTGNVTSLGLQSIIITDNENSNTEINSSNINLSSATTLANVVSLINLAGNTNANVVASVVSTEDTDANTKTYQLRLAGMDYTLSGQSIANVGISAGTYKKPASNIITKNYNINANWIRILHTPTSGNISQVLIRN